MYNIPAVRPQAWLAGWLADSCMMLQQPADAVPVIGNCCAWQSAVAGMMHSVTIFLHALISAFCSKIKNRKVFFGSWIIGIVGLGTALPLIAGEVRGLRVGAMMLVNFTFLC